MVYGKSLYHIALLAYMVAGVTWHNQASGSQMTHICWIEHVKKTPAGVDIYFMQKKTRIFRNNEAIDMIPESIKIGGTEAIYTRVSAVLGDELFLANSPEDGCGIKVVMQGGEIGLEASAYFNPPGFSRTTSKEFIKSDSKIP